MSKCSAPPDSQKMSSESKANILLVDDQLENLAVMHQLLQNLGQNVIHASSGEEALQLAADHDVALIVLAVHMPGMDGLETASLLRQQDCSRLTPIIFLAAHGATGEQIGRAYALGNVDFLDKPIVPEILRAKVGIWVDLHRMNEQSERKAEQLLAARENEYERQMIAIKERWDSERFSEKAVREKKLTAELILKAEELTRTAADRVRAEEQVREHARRQALIAQLGQRALAELDLKVLMDEAVLLAANVLGVECCVIMEAVPNGSLELRASIGLKENGGGPVILPAGSGSHAGYCLLVDEPVLFEDLAGEGRFETPFLQAHQLESGMAVIIRGPDRPFGVLGAYHPSKRSFTPDHVNFLQAVANVLGTAIQRKRHEQQLHEANRRKDEFLAMLAHELRNPLSPILNSLDLLRRHGNVGPTAEQSREVIERQVRQMSRLVDDLLDVSRITRGMIELRKEPVELEAIVTRAVESTRPLMEARGHRLEVLVPAEKLHLLVDSTRLEQILANLLNNAAKYTEPGGRIVLQAERQEDNALLRVHDSGIGMAPEMLPHIFDLFMQADRSLDRSQGGLGIGLTLVRSLVEMHGGKVQANSPGLGQGSEFIVRLPLSKEPVPAPTPPVKKRPEGTNQNRRVLIVEDNKDTAETLALLLQMEGHQVFLAHDGPGAIETAQKNLPEVILLDIGLPGMDGYEVAKRLRKQPETRDALLMAMTGYGQAEDRRRSQESGFDAHLVKPVDPTILRDLVGQSSIHVR